MTQIDLKKLQAHRTRTFSLPPAKRLSSPSQALTFVNARGFVYFWPIKDIDLPSLWTAVAGDRPVADKHDDPGHITWGWKDDALDKKIWYYGKILRGKATMISLEIAPYFYALSENYGSPEEDYLIAYHEGRLTQASKQVYETLLDNGSLNTLDLRKMAKLSNAKDSEFNKALGAIAKRLQNSARRCGAGRRVEVCAHLRDRHPPLSRSFRTGTRHQRISGARKITGAIFQHGRCHPIAGRK